MIEKKIFEGVEYYALKSDDALALIRTDYPFGKLRRLAESVQLSTSVCATDFTSDNATISMSRMHLWSGALEEGGYLKSFSYIDLGKANKVSDITDDTITPTVEMTFYPQMAMQILKIVAELVKTEGELSAG